MLIWCAGAYASGSTWAFNVACRLAELSGPVATRFAERRDVMRDLRSGDVADPRTHWHRRHAGREGAIGRWRRAPTRAQAEQVRVALADLPELFPPRPLPARARRG